MMESKKRDANKKKPKIYKQTLNENKKKEKELKKKEFKIHKQKFDENKKKEDEEPSSIFKKRRRFQLSENYLVPREESERRLQLGCIGLAFSLTIIGSALTLAYCLTFNASLSIILTPNKTTEKKLLYGYPVPHIAVIYNDGLVFDISLEDDISPSKNLLIKLPDERNKKDERGKRYAYQDQFGTLYFFSSTISRPVTQLQQKSRFHTITHNGYNLFNDRRVKLYSGAQLGNKFWIWGLAYHSDQHITDTEWDLMAWNLIPDKDSYIWHTKRQRWTKGPSIDELIREPCTSAGINATTAMIIAHPAPVRAYVYDFETNQFVAYPYLPEDVLGIPDHFVGVLTLATMISKSQRKAYCQCLMQNTDNPKNGFKALISFNLDEGIYGEWMVESTDYFNAQSSDIYLVLTVVRGLLYSFDNMQSNKAIGSVYQNGTLQELKSTTLAPGNHWPVFATPYFVRT